MYGLGESMGYNYTNDERRDACIIVCEQITILGEAAGFVEPVVSLARKVAERILCTDSNGCLVLGAFGSGHRESLELLVDAMAGSLQIVRMVGTEFGQNVPFGALLALLEPADESVDVEVGQLVRYFKRRLAEQQTLFVLEQPVLIDQGSLQVVAHLVSCGAASLVIATETLVAIPPELRVLCRSGAVSFLEQQPASRQQLSRFTQAKYGCVPSPLAIDYLWRLSLGNVGWFAEILRSALSCGSLKIRDHTLVVTDIPLEPLTELRLLGTTLGGMIPQKDQESFWVQILDNSIMDISEFPVGLKNTFGAIGYLNLDYEQPQTAHARLALLRSCLLPEQGVVMEDVLGIGASWSWLSENAVLDVADLGRIHAGTEAFLELDPTLKEEEAQIDKAINTALELLAREQFSPPYAHRTMEAIIENLLIRGELSKLEDVLSYAEDTGISCVKSAVLVKLANFLNEMLKGRVHEAIAELEGLYEQSCALNSGPYQSAILSLYRAVCGEPLRISDDCGKDTEQDGLFGTTCKLVAYMISSDARVEYRLLSVQRIARFQENKLLAEFTKLLLQSRANNASETSLKTPHTNLVTGSTGDKIVPRSGLEESLEISARRIAQLFADYSVWLNMAGFTAQIETSLQALESDGVVVALHAVSESPKGSTPYFQGSENLTQRERQIAGEVELGRSNVFIASNYGISTRTVEGHLYQIYGKVSVTNRKALRALIKNSRRAEMGDSA